MGRKLLTLVPSLLPSAANLERFQSDAKDAPFLSVVVWTSHSVGNSIRTRQLALDKEKCRLLELQHVHSIEDTRSWFVGNTVIQDGRVMVCSPFDALFVLLNAAWPHRVKFVSLFDLLTTMGNTWLLQLSTLRKEDILRICDVQTIDGDEAMENLYVRVNVTKTTDWLKMKVERVANVLLKQDQEVAAKAARTAAFDDQMNLPRQKQEKEALTKKDSACYYRQAIEVVGNCLVDDWIDLLCNEFKVKKEVEINAAAKATDRFIDTYKRFDRRETPDNGSKRPAPSSTASSTRKKSKLANVDRSGMRSLTSFFGKK